MYVRDYAPLGKSPRDYSAGSSLWPLAVRVDTTLVPGLPQRIGLDLAVKIDGSIVLQIIAREILPLQFGLRPTLGVEVRTNADELAPLSLLVDAPQVETTLSAGTIIADLLLLPVKGERLVPDADLDHEMYKSGSGISLDTSDEGKTNDESNRFPWDQ